MTWSIWRSETCWAFDARDGRSGPRGFARCLGESCVEDWVDWDTWRWRWLLGAGC